MSRKRRKERKPHTPPEKQTPPPAKTRTWTLPTVLGLILGVFGSVGIIELRPQITVSPQEPIEKSNPFSVPFRIDNTGYLAFHVDHVFAYASKIKVGNGARGPITKTIAEHFFGITSGKIPDKYNWLTPVKMREIAK